MNSLVVVANGKARQIDNYLRERQSDVATLARTPIIATAIEDFEAAFTNTGTDSPEYVAIEESIGPYLTYWQESLGYTDVFLISADGDIVWTAKREGDFGTNLDTGGHRDSELARVVDGARTLLCADISYFEYYPPSDAQAAFLAAPVMKNGHLVGVLASQISNDRLFDLMQGHAGLGETGETLVAVNSGNHAVLASPLRHDSEGAFRKRILIGSTDFTPVQKAVLGLRGSGMALDYRGERVLATWRYVPAMGLGMVVKVDTDEVFAPIEKLKSRILTAGFVLMLGALVAGTFASRSLAVPVIQLAKATRKFAAGELNTRVAVGSQDEIGQLASSFNTMASHLEQAIGQRDTEINERRQPETDLNDHVIALESANKALEQLNISTEAANQAKSEFLANMSHEIRTPMTAILGFTDLLLDNLDKAENIDAVRTVKDNGNYLINLINDILDLSKIEAGKIDVERIECSAHEIVADVASLMRVRSAAKGLPLGVRFDGPLPQTIQSDPTRLRQVLINVVGNAIKFTETGSIRIVTRMLNEAGEEPRLQFDVIDTGIGIPDGAIEKLFLEFTQADNSTTRKFGGTGLGLTISKRLAEALGGEISVSSSVGKGSTFSITVATGPLNDVRLIHDAVGAAAETADVKSVDNSESSLTDYRILLAEDGPDNQRLIGYVLKKAGAAVTLADNGQVGFDLATIAESEGRPFDVVLMDMQMPVLDGYSATRRLREKGYTRPVIALTAHAMSSDRQKCQDAGCNDYTTKPIDRRKLIALVASYGGRTEAAAETPVVDQATFTELV